MESWSNEQPLTLHSTVQQISLEKKITSKTIQNLSMQDDLIIDRIMTTVQLNSKTPSKLRSSVSPPIKSVLCAANCTLCSGSHSDTWHHFKPYTAAPRNSEPHTINRDHTADAVIVKHLTHLMPLNLPLYS